MNNIKFTVLDNKVSMDSEKVDSGIEQGEFGDQISQLQNLVEQMKEGFVLAMQELSHIQDGDRILRQKVNSNKEETDEKIEKLTESLQQIRTDLSSVLCEVKKNNKVTEKLGKQLESVRKEQSHMRKKMRQNEQNQENHRKDHHGESATPSNKSDAGEDNNNNKTKEVISAKKLARRRQSMPAAYTSAKEDRDRGRAAKESGHHTKMAPMMQPFMDSLPDTCDALNDDGSMNEPSEEVQGRQFDSFPSRHASGSSMSSDKDQGDKEHMTKAFNSGRIVSFSNLNQTQDSNHINEAQRVHLVEELLTSERKYVGQLNALRENIMLPLVTESLIHPSEINVIFPPSLAKMFDRHCCLLCALETRLGDTKWQGMHGDIVAKFAGIESADFLSQYGLYIDRFPESISLLSHYTRKSSTLTRFLKKQLADIEDEQADLLGYLLAPIQRIPAYVLHLKTVLEYTEADHPDYFHVESSLTYFGNFLALMNPAIEQAVAAARTYKLFLSERRASSYSSHILTTSQSSSLTKDSGMNSMDDMSTHNSFTHLIGPDGDPAEIRRESGGQFLSTWNGSPVRLRKSQKEVLSNGYKQDRRASFPMNARGMLSQGENDWKNPHMSKSHHRQTGRRASHDQRMVSESYKQGTTNVSAAIPGMTYIPEQTGGDIDFGRVKRRSSRSQSNLPELPTYGIYGEDDTDVEVRYEPSSPTSALPRTRHKGINQVSQGHRKHLGSPMSSESSSRTSTPRGDYHYSEHDNIIYDDSDDIHQRRKHHRRQSLNVNSLQRLNDFKSDERASSTMHLQETPRVESRRRANSISHMNRVDTPEMAKPETVKDVWNEENQVNGSMESTSSPRSKLKPTIQQSPRERSEPAIKSNKKSNFLTGSLRNIFFGKGPNFNWKRGSHVVNLSEDAVEKTEKGKTSSQSPTYCDEDGQPCSDV